MASIAVLATSSNNHAILAKTIRKLALSRHPDRIFLLTNFEYDLATKRRSTADSYGAPLLQRAKLICHSAPLCFLLDYSMKL